MSNTVPGIGPGKWDSSKLAKDQQAKAHTRDIRFRLYTEDRANLTDLVSRYFGGATLYLATGLWTEGTYCAECGASKDELCHEECSMPAPIALPVVEQSRVIEILGTMADLQSIVHLAGDIRERNKQSSVIVTYEPINRLDITNVDIPV